MQVWNRAPLPNASPLPRNRTLTPATLSLPERLARHDDTGGDAHVHRARAMRQGSHLLDPAADKREAVKAQRQDAVRERRESGSEEKGETEQQNTLEPDQHRSAKQMVHGSAADKPADNGDATGH